MPRFLRVISVRTTQTTFTVSATAIIVNNDNKVLLLDHVLRPNSGWALPGGFLIAGELAHEALSREIAEEIGLKAVDLQIIYANTNRRHIEIFFRVLVEGEPQVGSREIIGFKWFALRELPAGMSHIQMHLIKRVLDGRV